MLEIAELSKEQVYTVMRELLYSFNYMWFLMEDWARQNCPEKAESEAFHQLSRDFGAYQAKRLEKIIETPDEGVERLVRFLRHSHWWVFEDIELSRVSGKELRMRTRNCTAQRAAKRWGMEYYDCSQGGLWLRQGFFARINPRARVERIFTPPQPPPEGISGQVSCEWRIVLE